MKRIVLTILGIAAAVALVACAQAPVPAEKPKPTSTATEQPKPTAELPKPAAAAPRPTEPAKPKEIVSVRAALQGTSSDGALFIADAKGYFQEQGIAFKYINFSSASEMVSSLATGQVEVGGVSPTAAFLNAVSRDLPVKGVADKGRLSKGGGYIAIVVRKQLVESGKYKGLADLKGLRVAITPPATSNTNTIDMELALQKAGLKLNDIALIDMPLAAMPAGLAGGSIDVAVMAEPNVSLAVETGLGVRVLGLDEVHLNHQIGGLSYSPAFMKEGADVAKRFMVAYVKGARDYNDAFIKNKGRSEIISILAKSTSVKDAAVWEKAVPPGINPDGYLNTETIMSDMAWYFKNGVIKEMRKAEEIIDNQYADYAIGVLGKYQ